MEYPITRSYPNQEYKRSSGRCYSYGSASFTIGANILEPCESTDSESPNNSTEARADTKEHNAPIISLCRTSITSTPPPFPKKAPTTTKVPIDADIRTNKHSGTRKPSSNNRRRCTGQMSDSTVVRRRHADSNAGYSPSKHRQQNSALRHSASPDLQPPVLDSSSDGPSNVTAARHVDNPRMSREEAIVHQILNGGTSSSNYQYGDAPSPASPSCHDAKTLRNNMSSTSLKSQEDNMMTRSCPDEHSPSPVTAAAPGSPDPGIVEQNSNSSIEKSSAESQPQDRGRKHVKRKNRSSKGKNIGSANSTSDLTTQSVQNKSRVGSASTPITPDASTGQAVGNFEALSTASGTPVSTAKSSSVKQIGGVTKRRSHNDRRFHKLFHVPLAECLLSRFSCAYVGDKGLLVQGYLYVSYNHICFHSNIFGIEKVIELAVESIMAVTKERTARIIPNAIGIHTNMAKTYLFASLLSRDNTHQLLVSIVTRKQSKDPSFYSIASDETVNQAKVECLVADPDAEVSCSSEMSSSEESDGCSAVDENETQTSTIVSNSPDGKLYSRRAPILRTPLEGLSQKHSPTFPETFSTESSSLSVRAVFTWFVSLPKIVMLLLISVILLLFLFGCATILTFKLMYLHQNSLHASRRIHTSPFMNIPLDSLRKIESAIDGSLALVSEARKHLESLRDEVKESFSVASNFPHHTHAASEQSQQFTSPPLSGVVK